MHVGREVLGQAMISTSILKDEKAEYSNLLDTFSTSPQKKRTRFESGRYKGVVLQHNGHWGAQIYANHKRYWLGTFKSEKVAAMAYDSAAMKLRSEESPCNFPGTDLTLQEMFQSHHCTETILKMIRDGSYGTKVDDFVRAQFSENASGSSCNDQKADPYNHGEVLCTQLFQKELTPSDVGKLNRLVIPKKHATKYFPEVPVEGEIGGGVDDIQMNFYDKLLKPWKFRYCFWKSSQSFVFTRGWNRFVKDKGLQAKDVVTFCRCEYRDDDEELKWFCMIDVEYRNGENANEDQKNEDQSSREKILQLQVGLEGICDGRQKIVLHLAGSEGTSDGDSAQRCDKVSKIEDDEKPRAPERGIRIFGVQITA